MLWHILIPRITPLCVPKPLFFPLRHQGAMNDIDHFDEEGGCASSGVKNLDKRFVRGDGALLARLVSERGEFEFGMFCQHLTPSDSIGKPIGQSKLCLQELMDAANDVGHH